MSKVSFFYITVPDEKTGEQIASELLNKKLIACANILPAHKSLYVWKEELCNQKEHILILKTQTNLQATVEKEVSQLHPYECPCILTFSPTHGNTEFISWIESQTSN